MYPSGLSNVLGACDPVPIMQRNFDRAASAAGVSLLPVFGPGVDLEPEEAATAIQMNFNALAAATGLVFYQVSTAVNPEVSCQQNFEMLNAQW